MARDIIGIMQQPKLGRAHIVGSSLGAEVGLSIAANYPEKVISLVCDGALSSVYGPYGIWEGIPTDSVSIGRGSQEQARMKKYYHEDWLFTIEVLRVGKGLKWEILFNASMRHPRVFVRPRSSRHFRRTSPSRYVEGTQ